jgi:hypothetical protein
VLRPWHLRDKLAHALRALVWITVPAHGRVGAIEIRQVVDTRRGVVGRIVKTSEVVRCARRDLDADLGVVICLISVVSWAGQFGEQTYSSLVRLAMARKAKGKGVTRPSDSEVAGIWHVAVAWPVPFWTTVRQPFLCPAPVRPRKTCPLPKHTSKSSLLIVGKAILAQCCHKALKTTAQGSQICLPAQVRTRPGHHPIP